MDSKGLTVFAALGILGLLIGIVILAIGIVCYILSSYSLYNILKAVGYDTPWLAWIPFCQYFAIVMVFNYKKDQNICIFGLSIPRPVAGFASTIAAILQNIPFIGWIFPILALLINGFILAEMFDICEDSEPGKNTAMGIVSSVVFFIQIFMFFKYMKRANQGEIDIDAYASKY